MLLCGDDLCGLGLTGQIHDFDRARNGALAALYAIGMPVACLLAAAVVGCELMWIVKEAQCLRDSAFSFCKARARGRSLYEAGSIETLIRIVDENGGYTIIPEMHLPLLTELQRANVRRIEGDYLSQRRVSLYIRADYIRQHMLNTITATLLRFMPRGMMDPKIAKFGIRL